jgi:hypothetical protein
MGLLTERRRGARSLCCFIENESLQGRPDVFILRPETAAVLAVAVQRSGRGWVWIEGFSGAGKTSFASDLAKALQWRHVELDELVRSEQAEEMSYAERIDPLPLNAALGGPAQRQHVVVDGVCLQDVIALTDAVGDAYRIYLAKVSQTLASTLTWHDGLWMEDSGDELPWLTLETIRYHNARRPHDDADAYILRVE